MSDAAVIVLALLAVAGAWAGTTSAAPRPFGAVLGSSPTLVGTVALVVVSLARRRPVVLLLGVFLAAAALGVRAERGLRPPLAGRYQGVVTLLSDPVEVAGAVRADVRLNGKRVEAWARGRNGARLAPRLAGERVAVAGEVRPFPEAARARLRPRHVASRLSVTDVGGWGWGHPPSRLANHLRRSLTEGAASLPPDRRALLTGFVLGDDRGQPAEVVDDFRGSGLSHLLAVSGLTESAGDLVNL